jgi:Flp pilus assembly protein TadG
LGRGISEFETSLVYRVSSRIARAVTQRNLALRKQDNNKKAKTNYPKTAPYSSQNGCHHTGQPLWKAILKH